MYSISLSVGTGSLLVSCAQYGSMVVGSDIDIRMLKGDYGMSKSYSIRFIPQRKFLLFCLLYIEERAAGKDIRSNFKQYFGNDDRLLDLVVCDNAHTPWRETPGPTFDAIICDRKL